MSHAFYRTAQGRLPGLMSSKGKTTFSFFCSIQVKGMTTFFLISKVHSVCVKIIHMISQNSQRPNLTGGGGLTGN